MRLVVQQNMNETVVYKDLSDELCFNNKYVSILKYVYLFDH